MFSKDTYIKRREILKNTLKKGVVLICGNKLSPMNCVDNTFPFVQDSTFLYYFGLNKEDLVGVIDIDNDIDIIFGNELTMDYIIWTGPQTSLKNQASEVGITITKPSREIARFLKEAKETNREIHYLPQYLPENIINISTWLDIKPNEVNNFVSENLGFAVANQRNYKSEEEIIELEKAVNLTRDMHLEVIKKIKPGMKEYEVAAILENIARSQNAGLSFQSICTVKGQTLHLHNYNNTLNDGDLLLVDAGARIESGYCGDMTTTIPVSGKFTPRQKEIYDILISMFDKAEEIIKPGITYKEVHLEVCRVMAEKFIEKGFFKGNINEIIEKGVHALFMPHGLGHMLGLDVHDMENIGEVIVGYNGESKSEQFGLKSLRLGRNLEEGFVFTVEPGIYFIPELIDKWRNENKFMDYINYDEIEKYKDFTGMRYEGDFLVTVTGNRRLGDSMPKYSHEIEATRENAFK